MSQETKMTIYLVIAIVVLIIGIEHIAPYVLENMK